MAPRRQGLGTEASDAELRAAVAAWAAAPGGLAVDLYVAVEPLAGMRPNAAEVLALRSFADADAAAAVAWATSEDGGVAADLALAGRAFGTASFIAMCHAVVTTSENDNRGQNP